MKIKILLCLFLATVGQFMFAQTQQGYVKTLGRPEKKGEALGGVTVRVKGEHNPVVSKQDGTFSLLLADKKNGDAYALQQVKKSGYELNEKDLIGRQFAFSDKVPLTIVMVSTEQLQADKQRIENNAYKTAEKNYKAKYNLLEKQLSDNEITAEQYQKEIQDLQDKFEKYQSLIDGLAEHYAHTDYDELDEKDREINVCIENGELERADSLIQTLFDPIGVLERNMEALASIEQQIGQARGLIDQANADMEAVLKQQEKDAEYLYQLYTIALGRFDNEKAEFYIETRAELDTTNGEWQHDAARYFLQQNQFTKSEPFFARALKFYRIAAETNPDVYDYFLANLLCDYAVMYDLTQRLSESEDFYFEALEIFRRLDKEDPERTYEPDIANTLTNFGALYEKANLYSLSKTMYWEAIDIYRKLLDENHTEFKVDLALVMGNLAIVYSNTSLSSEAEDLYIMALDIYEELTEEEPQEHDEDMARTQCNLGALYFEEQRYSECESMFLKSLENYKRLTAKDPQANEPGLAMVYANLAALYQASGQISESLDMNANALDIYARLVEVDSVAYYPEIAQVFLLEALLYQELESYSKSEECFFDAIDIYEQLIEKYPQAHEPKLAIVYKHLAVFYYQTQRIEESETFFHKALEILWRYIETNPEAYAEYLEETLNLFDLFYKETQRLSDREALCQDALKRYQQLTEKYPEFAIQVAAMHAKLGTILMKEQKYPEAIASFQEALPYFREWAKNDSFYQDRLMMALYYISLLYEETNNIPACFQTNKELIPLMKEEYASDPSFQNDLVSTMGNQSYNALFMKDFAESERLAKDALAIDESKHWIATNLAAALLFQGKYEEAEKVYLQYKDEKKDSFLQDFNDFEAAGIIPEERKADVERIKNILNE